MYEVYKYFSRDWENCLDYSEESMLEIYISESYGDTECKDNNGYYVGKKWCNVVIKMWKEDIESGILFKCELYNDPEIPDWFIDKVFKK